MSFSLRSRAALPRLPSPHVRSFGTSTPRLSPTPKSAASDLDWSTYLKLRRSKRLYGLLASIPTTFAGFSVGAGYFATLEAEPTELIMGVEPIYAYAAATFGCVGLGWLSGPILGSALWKLANGKVLKAMEAKDRDFFQHIVRNRADPSRNSASNPAPDYYCEKVGSLKQYRQWLRDQSAYKRKATFGKGDESAY
ncbi:hypothetical protein P7C70_g8355, partial [Phenoliferia sp. Uapishka_3]